MVKLSCAFLGHREFNYNGYRNKLEDAIKYLIDIGVTEFTVAIGERLTDCARIPCGT